MSSEPTCTDCGAPLPADAPRGLCPNCLMGAALSRSVNGSGAGNELTVSLQPSGSAPSTFAAVGGLATLAGTLGGLPRVLLRDTESDPGPDPVVRPASPEVPSLADRSARLQLFGEIARGGMGAVLKGRDVDLGRDLAVKVLLEKHRDHPDLMRRFIEEAQIAGQLQHPGVVPIYELGAFADRRPYFAMKLVKGRTLADVLAGRQGPGRGPDGAALDDAPDRPDDGLRPRPGRDPPRLEALEHHGRQLRRGAGDGLGPGQGPAPRRRGR